VVMAGCAPKPNVGVLEQRAGKRALPRSYVCRPATSPIQIDGKLDDAAWKDAAWTEAFEDIEGDKRPKPKFETRAKLAWDAENLYIAAKLDEPHVRARLKMHDAIVFYDPDFEVFIDPNGDERDYYEIEMNALNTIFDLLLKRTYRAGGPAVHSWNLAGLRSAVQVDGTLNDPRDTDRCWTVELALPWKSLAEYAGTACPPRDGDVWRLGFSRVEWPTTVEAGEYRTPDDAKEDNWVWSPTGVVDMHRPERWGYLVFRSSTPTIPK